MDEKWERGRVVIIIFLCYKNIIDFNYAGHGVTKFLHFMDG